MSEHKTVRVFPLSGGYFDVSLAPSPSPVVEASACKFPPTQCADPVCRERRRCLYDDTAVPVVTAEMVSAAVTAYDEVSGCFDDACDGDAMRAALVSALRVR